MLKEKKEKFSSYRQKVIVDNGRFTIIKKRTFHGGIYPEETYNELQGFFQQIKKAENRKWLLENKT